MAIQKFGGNPEQDTDIRHISVSMQRRRWRKKDTKRYSTVKSNRRAAIGSLFAIYRHMYGKPNPAVHR